MRACIEYLASRGSYYMYTAYTCVVYTLCTCNCYGNGCRPAVRLSVDIISLHVCSIQLSCAPSQCQQFCSTCIIFCTQYKWSTQVHNNMLGRSARSVCHGLLWNPHSLYTCAYWMLARTCVHLGWGQPLSANTVHAQHGSAVR